MSTKDNFNVPMIVFDLETTGINPFTDLPVSASLLDFNPVTGEFWDDTESYFLIDPGCKIPDDAIAIHGITTEMARRDGKPLEVAIGQIYDTIVGSNKPIVGMNIAYDLTMVDTASQSLLDCRLPEWIKVIDILVLDRHFVPYRRGSRKLADLAQAYGVEQENAHNAQGDTTTTAKVLSSMIKVYPEITDFDISELVESQKEWHYDWASSYSDWRQQVGKSPLAEEDFQWPIRRPPEERRDDSIGPHR